MGLAAALEYMKNVEGWGGSVSHYFEKCAELGIPPPKVEELEGGFFRVTFYRKSNETESTSKTNDANHDTNDTNHVGSCSAQCSIPLLERVLGLIRENRRVTVEEMMLTCRVSRPTINRAISGLKAMGRIRRVDGTRGSWEVLK